MITIAMPAGLRPATMRRSSVAILSLAILVLAGCASVLAPTTGGPASKAPYVGAFTGEFVDGKPLYRFPSIEVVGSRSSVTDGPSEPGGI